MKIKVMGGDLHQINLTKLYGMDKSIHFRVPKFAR